MRHFIFILPILFLFGCVPFSDNTQKDDLVGIWKVDEVLSDDGVVVEFAEATVTFEKETFTFVFPDGKKPPFNCEYKFFGWNFPYKKDWLLVSATTINLDGDKMKINEPAYNNGVLRCLFGIPQGNKAVIFLHRIE